MYDIRIKNKLMRKKEIEKDPNETIFELEHRIKRTAKASIPLLHEIEKEKLKIGFKWMSQDGKTMVLVAPKNFEKKLNDNFKFVKE